MEVYSGELINNRILNFMLSVQSKKRNNQVSGNNVGKNH